MNDRRRALQRLNKLRAASPAPISGRDALLVNQISFYDDPVRFTAKIGQLCDELEEQVKSGKGVVPRETPRLMLSGCPMAVPNWKLPYVIESSGAVIVGEESCIGTRNTRDLVDESGESLDGLLNALVDRYIRIDCACFHAQHRAHGEHRRDGDRSQGGRGHPLRAFVLSPYAIEAFKVEKALKAADIPMLSIETDYSMERCGTTQDTC